MDRRAAWEWVSHRRDRRLPPCRSGARLYQVGIGLNVSRRIELGEVAPNRRVPTQLPPLPIGQAHRYPRSSPALPTPDQRHAQPTPAAERGLKASLLLQRSRPLTCGRGVRRVADPPFAGARKSGGLALRPCWPHTVVSRMAEAIAGHRRLAPCWSCSSSAAALCRRFRA
jgi:hypothetical protein